MKARTKKLTAISLGLIMGSSTFATVLHADTITKTLKATYNNIKVTFNGDYKQPANEPFMVNGSVYVSLRDAGQMTGNAVDWDSANKTVKITNSNTGNSASNAELANKNLEIANLKAQVKQLQDKLATLEKEEEKESTSSNLTKSAIAKTLEQIEDDFGSKHSVKWEFDLTENKGALELDITVPRNSSSKFSDITSGKLETFLEDICEDIAYNHKNVEIKGTVFNEKIDEDVVAFTYSTKGKFSIDSSVISQYALDRFAEDLEDDRKYSNLPTIDFEGLKTESFKITGIDLELDRKGETITFFVGVDTTKKDDWNKLITEGGNDDRSTVYNNARLDELDYFLEGLCEDIAYEFDIDTVEGFVYNTNGISKSAPVKDGKLMVKYELDRYDDYTMTLRPQ